MKKRLNIDNARQAMETGGLTQTAVAKQLGVSKEAVSLWLKEKSFPRPKKLLKLAKLLNLNFNELVIKEEAHTPVIAFRKRQGTKTKDHHIEKAQEMGRFLKHLVPYLPFDTLAVPPVLKAPSCDYQYLKKVTQKVRADINVSEKEVVEFQDLIQRFQDLQAVLVPVLWGAKQKHGNALHIYLPDFESTWVYLNLDTNVHDFKFWMAHELGHCLSPELREDEAEDFADAFAGMLLFSEYKAKKAYELIMKEDDLKGRMDRLIKIAKKEIISPYTIILQINLYAISVGQSEIELEENFYMRITRFNKQYENLSVSLFESDCVKPKQYIKKVEDAFSTPLFDVLSQYLKESQKGTGFVQSIMDIPLLDARGIYEELS